MSFFDLFSKSKTPTTDTTAPVEVVQTPEVIPDKEEIITISIGNTLVKVVGFDYYKTGRMVPAWHHEVYLGLFDGKSEGDASKNLQQSLPKAVATLKGRLEGKKHILVSMPVDAVFFRNIKVPKVDEIEKLLQAEAKKYIPIPFDEILFAGNIVAETVKDKAVEVSYFSVGIQKTVLEMYKKIFNDIGVQPYLELDIFSSARLLPEGDQYQLMVDVGSTHTTVILCKGQVVNDVFVFGTGTSMLYGKLTQDMGITFSEAFTLFSSYRELKDSGRESAKILDFYIGTFAEALSKEVSMTMLNFERNYSVKIKDIVFIGGGSYFEEIGNYVSTKFNGEVRVHFPVYDTTKPRDDFWNKNYTRFAQCFGLAQKQL